MESFVLMVALALAFAFDSKPSIMRQMFPGILWISFLFAGTLGIGKAFRQEEADDTLTGIFLAPGDRWAVFAAKTAVAYIFMVSTEILTVPIFFILWHEPWNARMGLWMSVLLLGALGLVEVATLLAAMTVSIKNPEITLSFLLIPLEIPVLIMAVQATADIVSPKVSHIGLWIHGLIAYDAIFLALPLMISSYLWEV